MQGITHFEELAVRHGFVVVYPGSQTEPPWHAPDDVSYLRGLIHHVMATQNIDPRRVYLAGFSAGGRATYYYACQFSHLVAAIAVVASVMREYPCQLSHPISEVAIDASGKAITGNGRIPSALQVAARWREFNGCTSSTPTQTQVSTVSEQLWGPCKGGSAVALWVVQGGHHTWPGTYGLAPGDPDAQFNASAAIWAFFAAHPFAG
jgi:polyhydroxybutyrate depolymerase